MPDAPIKHEPQFSRKLFRCKRSKCINNLTRFILVFLFVFTLTSILNEKNSLDKASASDIKQKSSTELLVSDPNNGVLNSSVKSQDPIKKTGTKKVQTPQASNSSNDFIFPDSSKRYLQGDELLDLNKEQLGIARNEIFARHGYIFKTEKYKKYFASKKWYKPNPKFKGSTAELNVYERYNVELIKDYESVID